jgi:hypothetical protein
MTQQAWTADDFQGLTPGVDVRRSPKFFALNGRNFVFDSKGVKSPFGTRLLVPDSIRISKGVQGFRVHLPTGDRTFHMFGDCVAEWDEGLGTWQTLYVTPDTSLVFNRWTIGYVNGTIYLCHPRVGLLSYDLDSSTMVRTTGEGLPTAPIAICTNNGRLIIVDDDFMYWSTQSVGNDFTPRLAGAGFQKIGDRVLGAVITVTAFAGGVLTWTTGGVMRSQFTADQAVYQHRAMNTEYRPINSFCTIKTDEDTTVILDKRGLFSCDGGTPQPYAPVFNEFLIEYIEQNRYWQGNALRMEWDEVQRRIYISVSATTDGVFQKAFVYYPPMDKWGLLNEPHFGVFPIGINFGTRTDDYFGLCTASGHVKMFEEVGSKETPSWSPTTDHYNPLTQKPAYQPEGDQGQVLSSSAIVNTIPTLALAGTRQAYLPSGGGVPVYGVLVGLDAQIQLGLLRFPLQTANDQLMEVIQLAVGSEDSRLTSGPSTDFNLRPPGVTDEDYNAEQGAESFGLFPTDYVNCQLRIIATMDGKSYADSEVPALVQFLRGIRYYSCSVIGVWHIFEMTAESVGEAFHLTAFELTAAAAGRLS